MLKIEIEQKLATYLAAGSFFVTVFLLTNSNTDPVNVTKLLALGGLSFGVTGIAIFFGRKLLIRNFKSTLIILTTFEATMILATFSSDSPLVQNFYGAYGRNNGLLTYSFLALLMMSSLLLHSRKSFEKVIFGFFAAGFLNLIYCAWVLIFGDFIPWNNPYGNILGLFGNPDFISAFLGMFIAGSVAYIVSPEMSVIKRIILSISSIIALFEIIKSHAIQGLVVTVGGILIVGYYFIRSKFKNSLLSNLYAALVIFVGFMAVMGTLQRGPFSFVYKRSVSLRGSYWSAGIEMGNSHPFTGIGLDSYGDWYRRTRPPQALLDMPGVNTTSNVAHNVVIDFFASGGFPLLLSYLGVLTLGFISIIRFTLRARKFDKIFVAISSVWLCYQVQSFISINQIGLAIWGWLFTGLLISYEYTTRVCKDSIEMQSKSGRKSTNSNPGIVSATLVAGIGLIIGVLISLPPFSADSKWFNAMNSQSVEQVERSLKPGFYNPADSYRYAQAVSLFQNSNLPDLAYKYAVIAVRFNPEYFTAWKQLYSLPNISEGEKVLALSNMKRLDPKNPDVTANS